MNGNLKEFGEFLKNVELGEFKPYACFEPCGNSISCFVEDVAYYAEWLNEQITLFRSTDDDRMIGVEVYGVRKMVQDEKD